MILQCVSKYLSHIQQEKLCIHQKLIALKFCDGYYITKERNEWQRKIAKADCDKSKFSRNARRKIKGQIDIQIKAFVTKQ